MSFLVGRDGPILTVHPLGGCSMAESAAAGVVDDLGRVFDCAASADSRAVFPTLVVLDGSVIPRAIGTNPALTISAIALRAARALAASWSYSETDQRRIASPSLLRVAHASTEGIERPRARSRRRRPADDAPTDIGRETKIEVFERLVGTARLRVGPCRWVRRIVELTLVTRPTPVLSLVREGNRTLVLASHDARTGVRSELRVFDEAVWDEIHGRAEPSDVIESALSRSAEIVAPLTGSLDVFGRERSTTGTRVRRAFWAWFWNRGLGDALRAMRGRALRDLGSVARTWWVQVREIKSLASHAGEVRTLNYELLVGEPTQVRDMGGAIAKALARSPRIRGHKRITYGRRSSVLRQLSEIVVSELGGMTGRITGAPRLRLDTAFLADLEIPLVRIAEQRDRVSAERDLLSLGAYVARLVVGTHLWSLRKPETANVEHADRLPQRVAGLPEPVITELEVERQPDGTTVVIRLSRFARPQSPLPPILALHGYSASGTTYAHPAIEKSFAAHFWQEGRDVWLLDMRTSSGLQTATLPWSFEDVAFVDIPAAVEHVHAATGRRLDVFAHCMGAAMLSMTILGPPSCVPWPKNDRFWRGPRAVTPEDSPIGSFPGRAPERLQQLEQVARFSHVPPPRHAAAARLQLQRVAVRRRRRAVRRPPPRSSAENQRRVRSRESGVAGSRRGEFVRFRRRMDALYGRDFSLKNIPRETLLSIEELFGPLSTDTLAQVLQFVLRQTIVDHRGRNVYLSPDRIRNRWAFPTLSVHGAENGLSDVRTVQKMAAYFARAGANYRYRCSPVSATRTVSSAAETRKFFEPYPNSSPSPTRWSRWQPVATSRGWPFAPRGSGPSWAAGSDLRPGWSSRSWSARIPPLQTAISWRSCP